MERHESANVSRRHMLGCITGGLSPPSQRRRWRNRRVIGSGSRIPKTTEGRKPPRIHNRLPSAIPGAAGPCKQDDTAAGS